MCAIPKSVCFHSEPQLSTFVYGEEFSTAVTLHQKYTPKIKRMNKI